MQDQLLALLLYPGSAWVLVVLLALSVVSVAVMAARAAAEGHTGAARIPAF